MTLRKCKKGLKNTLDYSVYKIFVHFRRFTIGFRHKYKWFQNVNSEVHDTVISDAYIT